MIILCLLVSLLLRIVSIDILSDDNVIIDNNNNKNNNNNNNNNYNNNITSVGKAFIISMLPIQSIPSEVFQSARRCGFEPRLFKAVQPSGKVVIIIVVGDGDYFIVIVVSKKNLL